jgi:hypothetical protein
MKNNNDEKTMKRARIAPESSFFTDQEGDVQMENPEKRH